MEDSFGDDEGLAGRQSHGSVLQVDQELAFDNVEEFVVMMVLVPVVFALNDGDADDGFIDFAEGLVEPLVFAGVGEGFSSMISRGWWRMLRRVSYG
jgi:hypothetical protein